MADLTESQDRALEQVATLFPYMRFDERMDWVSRLKGWFPWEEGNAFALCTQDILARSERITGRPWDELVNP
jgi:hypothetical protein